MPTKTGKTPLRTIRHLGLVVVILALTVAAYLFTVKKLRPKPAPLEKITIAHSTLPYGALAQIAQLRDFYRQEGLDAEPQLYSFGKLALEAVLSGKADFATVAETPVMLAIMNGGKLLILATIQVSQKSHSIIARKDRGIVLAEELKGRRIGTTLGTSADFYLDSFLLAKGVLRKEVNVVDLKPQEIPTAFMKGDVDAVSTWAPFLTQIQKEAGDQAVTFYDFGIYTLTFNVVATQQFVKENPGKVRKMLRALLRAEDFAQKNPLEAQKLVATFNNLDLPTLTELWGGSTFAVTLDQALLLALEDESRWALRSLLTENKAIPNYLEFIYLDGLQSVKPDRVGIRR